MNKYILLLIGVLTSVFALNSMFTSNQFDMVEYNFNKDLVSEKIKNYSYNLKTQIFMIGNGYSNIMTKPVSFANSKITVSKVGDSIIQSNNSKEGTFKHIINSKYIIEHGPDYELKTKRYVNIGDILEETNSEQFCKLKNYYKSLSFHDIVKKSDIGSHLKLKKKENYALNIKDSKFNDVIQVRCYTNKTKSIFEDNYFAKNIGPIMYYTHSNDRNISRYFVFRD